jgi:hypothetical protein
MMLTSSVDAVEGSIQARTVR